MILERVYRALLAAYPREHRREYGEPMVQLFRDRMRRDGGGFRTGTVWAQMIFDLVCSASRERKEEVVMDSVMVKRVVVGTAGFLLWSGSGAIGIYLLTSLAVLTAGLVSLLAGWYPFTIESGPLGFLGHTMRIDNGADFHLAFEPGLIGFFVLIAGVGLLIGVGSAVRAVRTSLWSWTDLG